MACLIIYMIDSGAGRRGSPAIVLGASAVIYVAALGRYALAGQPLAISSYLLVLVF